MGMAGKKPLDTFTSDLEPLLHMACALSDIAQRLSSDVEFGESPTPQFGQWQRVPAGGMCGCNESPGLKAQGASAVPAPSPGRPSVSAPKEAPCLGHLQILQQDPRGKLSAIALAGQTSVSHR